MVSDYFLIVKQIPPPTKHIKAARINKFPKPIEAVYPPAIEPILPPKAKEAMLIPFAVPLCFGEILSFNMAIRVGSTIEKVMPKKAVKIKANKKLNIPRKKITNIPDIKNPTTEKLCFPNLSVM